jgi:hypothetical protein
MARKRKSAETTSNRSLKRHKATNQGPVGLQEPSSSPDVHHNVLSCFYPRVCTLRNYLLACLPATSRVRRRKLTTFGKDDAASILDACLVGVLKQPSLSIKESRKVDFAAFTQTQLRETANNTGLVHPCPIDEVGNLLSPGTS